MNVLAMHLFSRSVEGTDYGDVAGWRPLAVATPMLVRYLAFLYHLWDNT
jgi:hypothetical protein